MHAVDKTKVFWRKVGKKTIVSNLETGFAYSLDKTAAFIWNRVLAGDDLAAVVVSLVNTYSINEQTARRDLEALLTDFKKAGLLSDLR